uniref:Eukaryotic translation initiation factor 4C n=1 Tax=Rhipicephalus microplus TaxID=6941 RepID=A0A6G4ZZJ3_RHIMP
MVKNSPGYRTSESLIASIVGSGTYAFGPLANHLNENLTENKGKGGKNRRRGKNENETEKRELVFKEDGQEYAQVIKMLGNGRLEAMCFDGMKRLCHIRGKLRKKVWINQGDIILVGLRDYQDAKADVILKYNPDEARNLKSYGELPEHAKINDTVNFGEEEEDDNIEFDEVSGDEDIEGI